MKKLGILFVFSIVLLSCTSENGIFLNGELPRAELDIKKIIEVTYQKGRPSAYKITIFKNRKIKIDSFYNKDRNLISYKKWNYNSNNFLVSIKEFNSLNVLIPEKTRSIFYDSKKRIDTIKTLNKILSFNYDASNLIIRTQFNSTRKDSLYLNKKQRIYKISNGLFATQLSISNTSVSSLKVTNLTTKTDVLTVKYYYNNSSIIPKGFLWKDTVGKTFKNGNNAVLFYSLQGASEIYSSQYLSHIARNGKHNLITYKTDSNGYLKEFNSSIDGDFRTKKTYFYE